MTKKLTFVLVAIFLIGGLLAPGAMAALTDQHQKALAEIDQKMAEYRNQLVDIYLDAGEITKEQADFMKEQHALRSQYRSQYGYGMMQGRGGFGMGRGCGMSFGGYGMGFGGYGMQNYPPTPAY